MMSIENKEMLKAKQRLQKATTMFDLAISDVDVDIAIAEQRAAELIIGKIIKEMKEIEKNKAHA